MLKKVSIFLIFTLILVGLSGPALAAEKYTTTSIINDVTVNWEYELNDSNEIVNLKCTNPADLTGDITIPSTLDEKTVISLRDNAFKSAINITGVTIPNSIKEIGYKAFMDCTNLTSIDLGQLEKLGAHVFQGCTELTSITIPKTLKLSSSLNNPNIVSITFEEGLTAIPDNLCYNTGITSITIPSSVKKIGYSAFENCANLTSVDLGEIEEISFNVFKDCPKLTSITIPKTLINGPSNSGGVFTGTTNLTSVTFEEGLTQIPSGILRNCTGITTVTIPNTVTKIMECAFQNSGLTEVTIPNSVKEISYKAFMDCANLVKITILDNCNDIGWFTLYPTTDTVFQNHNEDLTIYCYEGSKIAEYAIATNIKYVYLPRPGTDNGDEAPNDEELNEGNQNEGDPKEDEKNQDDDKKPTGPLPNTGATVTGIGFVLIASIAGVSYKKNKKFKDIK